MDDALLVRGFERLRDLPRDRQRFVERKSSPSRDPIGERLALDQLQDERAVLPRVSRDRKSRRCSDD